MVEYCQTAYELFVCQRAAWSEQPQFEEKGDQAQHSIRPTCELFAEKLLLDLLDQPQDAPAKEAQIGRRPQNFLRTNRSSSYHLSALQRKRYAAERAPLRVRAQPRPNRRCLSGQDRAFGVGPISMGQHPDR